MLPPITLILSGLTTLLLALSPDASVSHAPLALLPAAQSLAKIVSMNALYGETCAVADNGEVRCWGDGVPVPTAVPALTEPATAVAVGGEHACVITTKGAVMCWGRNHYGQLGNGTTTDSATPVAVIGLTNGVRALASGTYHMCALTSDHTVHCWGDNNSAKLGRSFQEYNYSTTPLPVEGLDLPVQAIATAGSSTCALGGTGAIQCWGSGYSSAPTAILMTIPSPERYQALTIGDTHGCAVTSGGGVQCWGDNAQGRLGNGNPLPTRSSTPINVVGLESGVTELAAGTEHTCARTEQGRVYCWGSNHTAQLGSETPRVSYAPLEVGTLTEAAVALAVGMRHTCALGAGGSVYCWGSNYEGVLGIGSVASSTTPLAVKGLPSSIQAVVSGGGYSCALATEGSVKCWGTMGAETSQTAVAIPGLETGITAIAGGSSHRCALTQDGKVKCWGDNQHGQLGDGSQISRATPVEVTGLSDVKAIAVGSGYSCALLAGGGVHCWGLNLFPYGGGANTISVTPTEVPGLGTDVTALYTGGGHACALTAGGGLKCWGSTDEDLLLGTPSGPTTPPVYIPGLAGNVTTAAVGRPGFFAGGGHRCVVVFGELKCWGANYLGQLGDGRVTRAHKLSDVIGLGQGVQAVAAGSGYTCALTSSRELKCWGHLYYGRPGLPTLNVSQGATPTTVIAESVITMSVGDDHACAVVGLPADNEVKCWGSNHLGQLGNGEAWYAAPRAVEWQVPSGVGDLSLVSVEPVQIVEGQPLIAGKATAVKVVVRKIGPRPILGVPLSITHNGVTYNTFQILNPSDTKRLGPQTTTLDFRQEGQYVEAQTAYFFHDDLKAANSGSYDLDATVDPSAKVAEYDETNNRLSLSRPLHTVAWGSDPALRIGYLQADGDITPLRTLDYYNRVNAFVLATFPVADAQFLPSVLPKGWSSSSCAPGLAIGFPTVQMLADWLICMSWTTLLFDEEVRSLDRTILVVPPGWFQKKTNLGETMGVSFPSVPYLVLAELVDAYIGYVVVTHELGHSYGLNVGSECEDYDGSRPCDDILDRMGVLVEPGLWVAERRPMLQDEDPGTNNDRRIYSFMGAYNDSAEYWTTAKNLNTLRAKSNMPAAATGSSALDDTRAILAAGTLNGTGTVSLDPWFVLEDLQYEPSAPSGSHTFTYYDTVGTLIHQFHFSPFDFTHGFTHEGALDTVPFVVRLPYLSQVAKITLTANGQVLVEKAVTPNAPEVTIHTPDPQDATTGTVIVTWAGTDPDGDRLTYELFYSSESSWGLIGSSLTHTRYAWDVSSLPSGNYRLKLVASDGVNASEGVSGVFRLENSRQIGRTAFLPLLLHP